jgi:hypothetical protein
MEIVVSNEQYPTDITSHLSNIRTAVKKTKEGMDTICQEMYELRQSCTKYGRPSFSALVDSELNIAQQHAGYMADVGEKLNEFVCLLPAGMSARIEFLKYTPEQRIVARDEHVIHPGATEKTLAVFRKKLNGVTTTTKAKAKPKLTIEGSNVELIDMEPAQVSEALSGLTDVIPQDILDSCEDHNDPEFFAAKSLAMGHEALVKSMDPLTKRESERVSAAVINVVQHNQKVFDYVLKKEKPKKIKALEDRLKKEIAEVVALKRKLVKGTVSIDEHGLQVMLRADFRRFLGALHPDRHPGQEEKYQQLFNDFKSYEDDYRA